MHNKGPNVTAVTSCKVDWSYFSTNLVSEKKITKKISFSFFSSGVFPLHTLLSLSLSLSQNGELYMWVKAAN